MEINHEVDLRGMNCPLPVLHTRKAINKAEPGEVLRVLTTDPGSIKDLDALCKQSGDELLSSTEEAEGLVFLIRKSA